MTSPAIERGLPDTEPRLPEFFSLVSLEVTDSTNSDARKLATDGACEGTLVWAKSQGAGRGRRGRDWVSPPGNLYASLVLRPQCAPATAAQISFVAALAIRSAVANLLPDGADVQLKWPNDVLVDRKKVAGILLESHLVSGGQLDWLVVGTGVNIASHPDNVERPATSLQALGSEAQIAGVLKAYADAMQSWYQCWQAEGFGPVRTAWLANAWGQGGPVEVRLGKETFHGIFEDLDDTGALIVSTGDGNRLVSAGDVFPVEQE
jgi:BirA family transcriptional regulator, biotin operon repressor / biotin---[acetyl-CoA-carboxylase] ligase